MRTPQGNRSVTNFFTTVKIFLMAILVLGLLPLAAQARQSFYFLAGETVKVYSMDGVFQESFALRSWPGSSQGYVGFATDGNTAWMAHDYEYDFITGDPLRIEDDFHSFAINSNEWGYCAGVAVNGNTLYLGRYKHYLESNPYRIELYNISTGEFVDQWYLSSFYPDLMEFVDGYLIVAENFGRVRFYDPEDGSMIGNEIDVSSLYPGHGLTALSADSNYIYVQFYSIGTNKAFAFGWDGTRQAAADVEFPGLGTPTEACIAPAPDVPILSADPAGIDFGSQMVGTGVSEGLTITNVGVANLTVSSISLSDATHYTLTAPGTPLTLIPGQSAALTISFTPQATGTITATLCIVSDSQDVAGTELTVGLSGESLASVFYVDAAADGSGTGTSWEDGFTSLNAALADAAVLDEAAIWVREGSYVLSETIVVTKQVSIYGGFPSDVADPVWSDRDFENHASVIDGNAAVQCVRITTSATLDGFTITNGLNSNSWPYDNGGGILVYRENNSAPEVHATIIHCTLTNNRALPWGYGGGISVNNYVNSTTIEDCVIGGNQALNGGGIHFYGPNTVIRGCRIENNQAVDTTGNGYSTMGGGIYAAGSSALVENCLIAGNQTNYAGAGVYDWNSNATYLNCTIAGNGTGGGLSGSDTPVVTNCIVWGNTDIQVSAGTVTYSDVDEDGYGAAGGMPDANGNIRLNPLFMNAAEGNYALRLGSPCIDAGTDTGAPDEDILGTTRPQGDAFDMGAYEYDGIIYNGPWYVDGNAALSGDGMSWAGAFASLEEAIEIAGAGEEIWVKAGTYTLADTISIEKAVKLYGGFTGVGTQRDLTGSITVIDGQGSLQTCFSITAGATVDGFTITGGNASNYGGGGMYIDGADPVINRCTFTENSASFTGGAIHINGSPTVSRPTISNCLFLNNRSSNGSNARAGAIGSYRSAPQIERCIFTVNESEQGGAIYLQDSAASPGITNCLFQGNSAGQGGALYLNGYYDVSPPVVMNCTFSGNRGGMGGAINTIWSAAAITNCIMWNNGEVATFGPEISVSAEPNPIVTYCDVEGGYTGVGNLNVNPSFVAPGHWDDNGTAGDTSDDTFVNGDYRLAGSSPCIDSATASGAPAIDLASTVRPQGDGYDMGAYEYVEEPDISLDPESLSFTVVSGETSSAEIITITNTGALDLVITDISIDDETHYTLTADDTPITLTQGSTTDISVVFSPDAIADFDAAITIISNDPDESPLEIPVTGEGIAPVQYAITASAGTGGSISPAGEVLVNHGGSQAFTITPDTGYHIADVLVDDVSQGTVATYTFTNVTEAHTISATFAVNTYTITASAGDGGGISPASATVNYGGSQALTITPNTGYHIADVLVDDVSQGAVATYTFTNVTEAHTISATFAVNTYTITASAGDGGNISPASATVNYGGSQTFTFTPEAHYHVADVLVDGSSVGASSSYTFSNVTAGHTISVSFTLDTFTITASAGTGGSISPSGATVVTYGSSQPFSITPNTGYHLVDVVVDSVSVGAVSNYVFENVTAAHTISATFAIDTFTITASAGANGGISPASAIVNYGSNQTFIMTPDAGYHVADVLVDSSPVGAVSSYTFSTVTAGHTISATFALNTYTITASAGTGGSISPSGSTGLSYGDDQIYSITANPGYHIAAVLVDGSSVGALSSFTFSDVDANHTISASFAINTYTIDTTAGSGGSITPGDTVVNYGSSQTFTFTPDANYHVADVLVDGSSVGAGSSYTFTNVTAGHTINATFAIDTFTLTLDSENGTVEATPEQAEYAYGTGLELTAVADDDYVFDSWSGDASGEDNPLTITMTADTAVEALFVPDEDNDGISTEEEQGPDGTTASYDGNSDTVADAAQANVVSYHTYDAANYLTLASPALTEIAEASTQELPESAPAGYDFPYGLISFAINNVTTGGSATMVIYLPEGQTCDTYYKLDEATDTWEEFLYDEATGTGAVIEGNIITLHFVDGGRGDQDGSADGIITDPGTPAVSTGNDDDDNVCFIATSGTGSGLNELLTACMILVGMLPVMYCRKRSTQQ